MNNFFIKKTFFILIVVLICLLAYPCDHHHSHNDYVKTEYGRGYFKMVSQNSAADILVELSDYKGVIRAVNDLQSDINKVTDILPVIKYTSDDLTSQVIIIGTIGKSTVIDSLIDSGKIDVTGVKDKWESFVIQKVRII